MLSMKHFSKQCMVLLYWSFTWFSKWIFLARTLIIFQVKSWIKVKFLNLTLFLIWIFFARIPTTFPSKCQTVMKVIFSWFSAGCSNRGCNIYKTFLFLNNAISCLAFCHFAKFHESWDRAFFSQFFARLLAGSHTVDSLVLPDYWSGPIQSSKVWGYNKSAEILVYSNCW